MTPEAEFMECLSDLIAEFDGELEEAEMVVLMQARCMVWIMDLNEASRAYIGQCVGVAAAQMDGRTVH